MPRIEADARHFKCMASFLLRALLRASQRRPPAVFSFVFWPNGSNCDVPRDLQSVNVGAAEEPNSFPLASDPQAPCLGPGASFPSAHSKTRWKCVSA